MKEGNTAMRKIRDLFSRKEYGRFGQGFVHFFGDYATPVDIQAIYKSLREKQIDQIIVDYDGRYWAVEKKVLVKLLAQFIEFIDWSLTLPELPHSLYDKDKTNIKNIAGGLSEEDTAHVRMLEEQKRKLAVEFLKEKEARGEVVETRFGKFLILNGSEKIKYVDVVWYADIEGVIDEKDFFGDKVKTKKNILNNGRFWAAVKSFREGRGEEMDDNEFASSCYGWRAPKLSLKEIIGFLQNSGI